jgi:hypothetical protein
VASYSQTVKCKIKNSKIYKRKMSGEYIKVYPHYTNSRLLNRNTIGQEGMEWHIPSPEAK